MPDLKLNKTANELKQEILTLAYKKEDNNGYILSQLENVVAAMNKEDAPAKQATQQVIILGAILFAQEQAGGGYFLRDRDNSRLHKALGEISLVQQLKTADDSKLATSFCMRSFYEWYQDKAFDDSKRIVESPLCGTNDDHKNFEPILEKLEKDLPQTTPKQEYNLTHKKPISHTGYTLEVAKKADPSWSSMLTFGLWSKAEPVETQEEKIEPAQSVI